MSLLSSVSSLPSSSLEWVEALGFVPTPAARAAATPKKVAFLKLVKEANPSVGNSFVQNVLLEQISEICFELKGYTVRWLAKELGNQFLTISTKEVRESTRTFAIFSLNQISEEVLSGITIRHKKKRFRDWRDVVFTTVFETPVVEYKPPDTPVPAGYELITNNHRLLRAAEEYGNCAFRLSQDKNILEGTDYIAVSHEVMVHVKSHEVEEVKHRDNKGVSRLLENRVVYDFTGVVKNSIHSEGWCEAEKLPYTYLEGGLCVEENLRTPDGWFRKAQPLPYTISYDEKNVKTLLVVNNDEEFGWHQPCRLRAWHLGKGRKPASVDPNKIYWD